MSIISSIKPYQESLSREIELQIQDQILAGHIQVELIKNGNQIKYKNTGHVDIIYFKEIKRHKSIYFPGASGISIKKFPKAMSGTMGVYIGKKGKIHEVAVMSHKILDKEMVHKPVFLMEGNFLFLSLLQKQLLETFEDLLKEKEESMKNSHVVKIANYLLGRQPIRIQEKELIKPNFPLNEAQLQAYTKICSLDTTNFLTVIHGPPGTGKTQVIASAINTILKNKEKILITSHTNVAVDNALEKILDYVENQGIDPKNVIMRIGSPLRADTSKLVPYYVDMPPDPSIRKDGIVVGATISRLLLMINTTEFNFSRPPYDYVFLDEASMANFPQTLTAMIMAEKVVLLGDPHQLPPIVRDEQAKTDVLTSLFQKIIENDPSVFTFLNTQYRSHPSIANYSSIVFYEGKLKSHESTKSKGLDRKINDEILSHENHLLWIDTISRGSLEWKKLAGSYSGYNLFEASIIACLVKKFAQFDYNIGRDIRIITPFRLQAAIIEQIIREEFEVLVELYESQTFPSASTIDRIQGREAKIVILSLVDDGSNWRIHKVLSDYRRINVGLTRAKDKLIIVGSSMLKDPNAPVPYFRALGQYIEKKGTTVSTIEGCDMKYFQLAGEVALKTITKSR